MLELDDLTTSETQINSKHVNTAVIDTFKKGAETWHRLKPLSLAHNFFCTNLGRRGTRRVIIHISAAAACYKLQSYLSYFFTVEHRSTPPLQRSQGCHIRWEVGSLEIAASEHLGQGTWLCFPLPQHERGGESWKQGWAEIEEREQISRCMCLTDAAGIRGRRELQKGLSTRKHGMLHKQEPKPTGKACPQPTLLSRHRSCHEGIAYQLF